MNHAVNRGLEALVRLVATAEWAVPIRAMEALLAFGSEAVDPLRKWLREHPERDEDEDLRFWPIILLGELRDPAAAPELAEVIRGSHKDSIALHLAAAEAMAKIGGASLPELRSLAASPTPHHRLWAYYAAGRIAEDDAFHFLLSALETDAEMADVIALALSDQGRPEAGEPILRVLEGAESWQRSDIEDALAVLHGVTPRRQETPEDWRLRYRWQPGIGFFPLSWVTIGAMVRDEASVRRQRTSRPRSLEEILAEAKQDAQEQDLCDCCGVPMWYATGVPVCPETAASLPFIQDRMLGEIAAEESLEDLFDVLDVVEERLADVRAEKPVGRTARKRWEDRQTWLQVLRTTCFWLIQQGVETVEEGLERLKTEAAQAAVHGSPMPMPIPRGAPAPAPEPSVRVGRNDPCPCGSGRKFKKCCGAAG
jgi:hypothetical protein